MFQFFVCFLIFLSLYARNNAEPECGVSEHPFPPAGHRIINGTLVKKGELPWVTAILIHIGHEQGGCTGSIISRNHVLFAAHCCPPGANYTIIFGTNDEKDKHAVIRTTAKVHPHKDYVDFKQHDIAILEFDEPLTYDENIRPICLMKIFNETISGKHALISGFGAKKYFTCSDPQCRTPPGASDGKLRRGSEILFIPEYCEEKFKTNTTEFICGSGFNETDVFSGDSGGPLMMRNGNRPEQWLQVGICSFGSNSYPIARSAFTRVSLYCDWIAKTTKNAATCQEVITQ